MTCSATFNPSTAALVIPPAYPAPAPHEMDFMGPPMRLNFLGRNEFALRKVLHGKTLGTPHKRRALRA